MVMATEEGIIEKAFENKAVVRIQRSSACAHCQSKGACEMLSDKEMLIEVSNQLHAKDGDRVEISLPARSLLKMSLFVYFLPIVALVIGAVLGGEFAGVFHLTSTMGSIGGGAVFMAGAYFLLKRLNRGAEGSYEYQPQITRILDQCEVPSTRL
ncbi:SoxR reducing system RseC family protein [Thermodesulfobacteriota bacterium]